MEFTNICVICIIFLLKMLTFASFVSTFNGRSQSDNIVSSEAFGISPWKFPYVHTKGGEKVTRGLLNLLGQGGLLGTGLLGQKGLLGTGILAVKPPPATEQNLKTASATDVGGNPKLKTADDDENSDDTIKPSTVNDFPPQKQTVTSAVGNDNLKETGEEDEEEVEASVNGSADDDTSFTELNGDETTDDGNNPSLKTADDDENSDDSIESSDVNDFPLQKQTVTSAFANDNLKDTDEEEEEEEGEFPSTNVNDEAADDETSFTELNGDSTDDSNNPSLKTADNDKNSDENMKSSAVNDLPPAKQTVPSDNRLTVGNDNSKEDSEEEDVADEDEASVNNESADEEENSSLLTDSYLKMASNDVKNVAAANSSTVEDENTPNELEAAGNQDNNVQTESKNVSSNNLIHQTDLINDKQGIEGNLSQNVVGVILHRLKTKVKSQLSASGSDFLSTTFPTFFGFDFIKFLFSMFSRFFDFISHLLSSFFKGFLSPFCGR